MDSKKKIIVIISTIVLFILITIATIAVLGVTNKNAEAPDKTAEQQKIEKLLKDSTKAVLDSGVYGETESSKKSKQEIEQQAASEIDAINNTLVVVSE